MDVPSTSAYNCESPAILPHYNNFMCGWGAAFVETFATYPVSKVSFRQQLHGVLAREAATQLKVEGGRFLYRGLLPPLLQKTTNRSLMFGIYDTCKWKLGVQHDDRFGLNHALAAMIAGSIEALMCPFERIQTLLQTVAYHDHFKNTLHSLTELRPYGFAEYYRGMSVILLRNGPSNVLFFALRTPLKELFESKTSLAKEDKTFKTAAADFGSGAVLGCGLSTLFFPVNVVKSRMQSKLGGEFENPFRVFLIIWKERNGSCREFYRGWSVNFYRSFFAWGITNMVFELLQKHVFNDEG